MKTEGSEVERMEERNVVMLLRDISVTEASISLEYRAGESGGGGAG